MNGKKHLDIECPYLYNRQIYPWYSSQPLLPPSPGTCPWSCTPPPSPPPGTPVQGLEGVEMEGWSVIEGDLTTSQGGEDSVVVAQQP